MILSCERCDARYALDTGQLGGSGRKVRCTSCGHTWFQAPEASTSTGDPLVAPEFLAQPAAAARAASRPRSHRHRARLPCSAEFGATTPPRKVEEKRRNPAWRQGAFKLAAAILPTALLAAALIGFRSELVEIWPPIARLYSAIGALPPEMAPGLAIRSVHMQEQMQDGHRTVIVDGEVANTGTEPHKVPALHAKLAQGEATMARWSFTAGPAELAPGEAAPFHTQLADAPEGAQSVSVSLWQ